MISLDVTQTAALSGVAISGIAVVLGILWKSKSELLKTEKEFSDIKDDKQRTILDSAIVDTSTEIFSRLQRMTRLEPQSQLNAQDRQHLTEIVFTAANLNTVKNEISRTVKNFTNAIVAGLICIGMIVVWCAGSLNQTPLDFAGWIALVAGLFVFLWGVFSIGPTSRFKTMNQGLKARYNNSAT